MSTARIKKDEVVFVRSGESAGKTGKVLAINAKRGVAIVDGVNLVKKSGDKTIVVLVERRYQHPVYGKQLVDAKKYHTHDEKNEAAPGDFVVIQETRPLSKLKRWRLVKILRSAAAAEKKAEEAAEAVIAAEEAAGEGK